MRQVGLLEVCRVERGLPEKLEKYPKIESIELFCYKCNHEAELVLEKYEPCRDGFKKIYRCVRCSHQIPKYCELNLKN